MEGIDVILTGHTHDALPAPMQVGQTLLIASGSNGKFISRLDLEVENGRVKGFSYALIPMLADAITPDPAMAGMIAGIRAPHEAMLSTELGRTEGLLYRRGTFSGTLDDLICDAVLAQRDAEIALSPGFRWGPTLLPGQPITWDDIYNATAITYPEVYRTAMNGAAIKRYWRAWPTICSIPILISSRAAIWCASEVWALRSMWTASWASASATCTCSDQARRSRRTRTTSLPAGPRSMRTPKGLRSGMSWRRT